MPRPKTSSSAGDGGARGRYANYFEIGHNAFEFVIDCGEFYAGEDDAHLHTRIVMSPAYAKRLAETLHGSLARYETSFGAIPEEPEDERGPAGEREEP